MASTTYRVTDRDGKEVTHGDPITDFRGEVAWFNAVDRGPEYNGTAKVSVRHTPDIHDHTNIRSYYDRVFDLTVTPVTGDE